MCQIIRKVAGNKVNQTLLNAGSLLLLLLVVLSGGLAVAQAGAGKPAGPSESEMVAVMEFHYRSAIAAHDALIRGDLDSLRSRAGELITQPLPPNAPDSWGPFDARLREAAGRVASVEGLEDAGPAMAAVAEACGACHAAAGAGKIYFWPSPPDEDGKVQSAMHNHQWASERLWEGVTGPFDEAWKRGAKALAEGRVFGGEVKNELRTRDGDLRDLGRMAVVAVGLHDRAQIYGRLLATCADCHNVAGVKIPHAKSGPPGQR